MSDHSGDVGRRRGGELLDDVILHDVSRTASSAFETLLGVRPMRGQVRPSLSVGRELRRRSQSSLFRPVSLLPSPLSHPPHLRIIYLSVGFYFSKIAIYIDYWSGIFNVRYLTSTKSKAKPSSIPWRKRAQNRMSNGSDVAGRLFNWRWTLFRLAICMRWNNSGEYNWVQSLDHVHVRSWHFSYILGVGNACLSRLSGCSHRNSFFSLSRDASLLFFR